MSRFFPCNIDNRGRLVRGVMASLLLLAGALLFREQRLIAVLLLLFGGFVAFEALRGWCAVRACGMKTKL